MINPVKKRSRLLILFLSVVLVFCSLGMFSSREVKAADNRDRLKGIDVSTWNGLIDWAAAKKDGVDFAIIRIGWGSNQLSQDDSYAIYNMTQCEKYDIPYGVYIYSYALSSSDVDSEIAHMIRMANGHTPALGYWFDMEDADYYKSRHDLDPYTHGKKLTNFCLRFLRKMKAKGFDTVGVYANPDYFYNVLDYDAIKAEGMIWLAHWGVSSPGLDCVMWQYSATGKVAGNTGQFDMNAIFEDSYLYPYAVSGTDGVYKRISGQELIYDDVNGDGVADKKDLQLIREQLNGLRSLDDDSFAVEISQDGQIYQVDTDLKER